MERFINKDAKDIVLNDLLEVIIPEELEIIGLKSKVINNFYTSYLNREEVLHYKNMFSYRIKDPEGTIRSMLYQAVPLSVLENGTPEHVFCIQTDVSHLKMSSTKTVSFLNLNGGNSFYNVDISKGMFTPEICDAETNNYAELLTAREKQIVIEFSKGLNAEQIAKELHLSPHTIKTHRRNILEKSKCTNTTELVAKCLINGVIFP